jgi:hypothetical protein
MLMYVEGLGWGGSWQDLFCSGYEPMGGSYILGNEYLLFS